MRKHIMSLSIATFLLTGGAVTAFASDGPNPDYPPDTPQNMGIYYSHNLIIQSTWNSLSEERKQWYITYGYQPSRLFPFGIDTVTGQPKGYPTCVEADYPASYAPVLPNPSPCACTGFPSDLTCYSTVE